MPQTYVKDPGLMRGDVNARERVRAAIRQRLEELGMTGRAFGKAFPANDGKGHVDTWVSGLLNGQFALSLEELDDAARILKTTSADLVKSPYQTAEYLTPTEHRILEAARAMPPAVRDHFRTLAEYLLGVAPEEIEHLMEFRSLTQEEQQKVQHWTHALRLAQEPAPGLRVLPDHRGTDAPPNGEGSRTRGLRRKK